MNLIDVTPNPIDAKIKIMLEVEIAMPYFPNSFAPSSLAIKMVSINIVIFRTIELKKE
ncbi:hypothetical protein VCRA2117O376_60040 [Vibrio crassostreae]|nr:hypothetical protein VCRA2117O378_300040 [Vibrio crassostreae]CAK2042505.1 hypothetical protein VCRA2119O381_30122 [Vibrio crassostreae]CAK2166550.1 hypothetical protein VCRA2117O376_60040 [Vibrio crassostreae]CAK2171455.1 hypothetical protein VCRA2113O351_60039 [Vibrio crassostreae]CAK2171716.1 hypothetical protein VCRA2114O367_60039 [Vibrio crassostreae]